MIYRMADLVIDPDRIDDYIVMLAEEIEASLRLEPGVVFLFAVRERLRPHHVRVFEGYADQAAYAAHLVSPHFLTYKTGTAGMVQSLVLHDMDPVKLRAQPGFLDGVGSA